MRFLLMLIMLHSVESLADKWEVTKDSDLMDGSIVLMAISPPGDPVGQLPFPYTSTKAALVFRCKDKEELMPMIVLIGGFNFDGNRTGSGSSAIVRMRWGETLEDRAVFSVPGTDSLYIRPSKELVSLAMTSPSFRVELPLFGHGSAIFDIPLAGSSSAISEALDMCPLKESTWIRTK